MPESESEDEILQRIEVALRKISAVAQPPKAVGAQEIDRAALVQSLDHVISHLRAGLRPPGAAEFTE